MQQEKFHDRQDAGKQLAKLLSHYSTHRDIILLALPRGGIPVAYPIAHILRTPIYPYIVRKLGVPGYSELAMGAIAIGGSAVFNEAIIDEMGVEQEEIERVMQIEKQELTRREKVYFSGSTLPPLRDKTVILIDDGIATGATIKVAIAAIKSQQPARIIVAVPICPDDVVNEMRQLVDDFVCLLHPSNFGAVGECYDAFPAVEDNEVKTMLQECQVTFEQRS